MTPATGLIVGLLVLFLAALYFVYRIGRSSLRGDIAERVVRKGRKNAEIVQRRNGLRIISKRLRNDSF